MIAFRAVVLLVVIVGFSQAVITLPDIDDPVFIIPEKTTPRQHSEPILESAFISGNLTPEVHSATAIELNNGDIRVFWYGGEREGSKDTLIYTRLLDQSDNSWSDIEAIMSRQMLSDDTQRYIRKLGNPLAAVNGDQLWLFFVSVSVGGWGGSSINLTISDDNGRTWGPARRLISSPFLNISTLVKNPPLMTTQGDMILPVYHEFLGKFGELLHLDNAGNISNKIRISHGRAAIQPNLLPLDTEQALVFMRNSSRWRPGKLWTTRSQDGLASWTPLEALTLPNPDAGVAAIQLDTPEELLLVFNNNPTERHDITMAYRADSTTPWQIIHQFETWYDSPRIHNPFSYPVLLQTREGDFHLFYTWEKRHIKHVYFNRAALLDMLPSTGSEL